MAIQDENGVILRNIQEQVQKNKDDIESLKQAGMGHFPIPGPQGPVGPQGDQGVQGERGPGYYGTASMLPSPTAYVEGDMFLLNDGSLYKNVRGRWVLQASMRGPQGIQGETGTEVIANPEGEPQNLLDSISIDGVRYSISPEVNFSDIQGNAEDNESLSENLQDIREVAEGKCKSYVLDDEFPIPGELDLESLPVYGYDGTRIDSIQALNSFVGLRTYANMEFANQYSTLNLVNRWIIVQDNLGRFIVMNGATGAGSAFHGAEVGDLILVKQTDVPDRWLGVGSLWHKLETTKVVLGTTTKFNSSTVSSLIMLADCIYLCEQPLTSLSIEGFQIRGNGFYEIKFTTGETFTSSFPSSVNWMNGEPQFDPNSKYTIYFEEGLNNKYDAYVVEA